MFGKLAKVANHRFILLETAGIKHEGKSEGKQGINSDQEISQHSAE